MKKQVVILLAILLLTLCACSKQPAQQPPAAVDTPAPPEQEATRAPESEAQKPEEAEATGQSSSIELDESGLPTDETLISLIQKPEGAYYTSGGLEFNSPQDISGHKLFLCWLEEDDLPEYWDEDMRRWRFPIDFVKDVLCRHLPTDSLGEITVHRVGGDWARGDWEQDTLTLDDLSISECPLMFFVTDKTRVGSHVYFTVASYQPDIEIYCWRKTYHVELTEDGGYLFHSAVMEPTTLTLYPDSRAYLLNANAERDFAKEVIFRDDTFYVPVWETAYELGGYLFDTEQPGVYAIRRYADPLWTTSLRVDAAAYAELLPDGTPVPYELEHAPFALDDTVYADAKILEIAGLCGLVWGRDCAYLTLVSNAWELRAGPFICSSYFSELPPEIQAEFTEVFTEEFTDDNADIAESLSDGTLRKLTSEDVDLFLYPEADAYRDDYIWGIRLKTDRYQTPRRLSVGAPAALDELLYGFPESQDLMRLLTTSTIDNGVVTQILIRMPM